MRLRNFIELFGSAAFLGGIDLIWDTGTMPCHERGRS